MEAAPLPAGAQPLVLPGCAELYRNLLEQASEGVFVTDTAGQCLLANPAGALMLGHTVGELVGQGLLEHVTAVTPAGMAEMQRQLDEGRTIQLAKVFRRKDGSEFPGELTGRRLSNGTIQCILRDTSERWRAENAAHSAEGRLREIMESSPIGVFFVRVGPEGEFVAESMNLHGARILGIDRAKADGKRLAELVPAGRVAYVESVYSQCRESGAPVDYEGAVASGGEVRLVHWLLVPLRDADGTIRHIAGFLHDITGHKRAELALRESEARFSTIFHGSPDAIVVCEFGTGRVLEANDSFLRILGRTSDEVRGKTMPEIGILPSAPESARVAEMLAAHIAVRDFEIRCSTPAGERICLMTAEWIELGGRPCVLALVADVTELRRAERERAAIDERARQAAADFTRRLIESQEAERQRIARELHDSLGQELLLIANRLQLALGRTSEPPVLHAELHSIGALAAQAVAEVRRISHALRPPQLDHLGLTRALHAMLERVGQTAEFKLGHHLDDIDDVYPSEVETNWYRILQECLNNIIKHARARNVEVALERDIHVVRLIVADDGCGFEPESAEAGGFGLRSIAERVRILCGQLRIDSAPGTGTRLEIVAPIPKEI